MRLSAACALAHQQRSLLPARHCDGEWLSHEPSQTDGDERMFGCAAAMARDNVRVSTLMTPAPVSSHRVRRPAAPVPLQSLPPVVSAQTQLLILGSFPGERSLLQQQYYAHPRNQFWKILQAMWPQHELPDGQSPDAYARRCQWLLARGLGLWDVYGQCTRVGSLDSAIRDAVPNDIAALSLPKLRAIGHNGSESFKHARHTALLGVPVFRLPSTSPANASWSFERKLEAWRAMAQELGLV